MNARAVFTPAALTTRCTAREDEYAREVLRKYAITGTERAQLVAWADDTRALLRNAFGPAVAVAPAGSLAKSTLVRAAYDLDVVATFPASVRHRPSGLYEATSQALEDGFGKQVTRKQFALRVPVRHGFHVDVVPVKRSRTGSNRVHVHRERPAGDMGPRGFRMDLGREPAALAATPGLRDVVRLLKV